MEQADSETAGKGLAACSEGSEGLNRELLEESLWPALANCFLNPACHTHTYNLNSSSIEVGHSKTALSHRVAL